MITAMLRSTAMLLVLCGTARAEQPFDPFQELKEGIGQDMEVGGDMPDDVSGGNVVIGTAGNVVGDAPGIRHSNKPSYHRRLFCMTLLTGSGGKI